MALTSYRLIDVTTKIGSGATPTGGKEAYLDVGIPLIRSMNVHDLEFIYKDLAFIDVTQASKLSHVTVQDHDVLLNITGASVARCCASPKSLSGARVNQHVAIIRADGKRAWGPYLARVLASPMYKDKLLATAGGGATREALTKAGLEQFEVQLPELETQRKCASILSAYDDLIENNTGRIAILEEMARRTYEEWFVHFRAPGNEGLPRVDSPLGPIPQGWQVNTLRSIAAINPEQIKVKRPPERIGYIDIASVSPGRIDQVTSMGFAEAPSRARRIVRAGDVIWSCVRPNRRSYAFIQQPGEDWVASTGFVVLRPKPRLQAYTFHAVTTNEFIDYLVGRATGAAYPAVTADTFESAPIIIPPSGATDAFEDLVGPIMLLANSLLQQCHNLRSQRDLLLPKLISGEIDVLESEELLEAAE